MTIDAQLLKRAKDHEQRLAAAEREALLAKADYHNAVRRLHLAGASLREVAGALGLSHQRVQQIVRGAGGSWWQRVWWSRTIRRDAVCTFCGGPPSEVDKLIAGPNVYICDLCVAHAEKAAAGARSPLAVSTSAVSRCSFCGRRRSSDRALFASATAKVCSECLGICRRILDDRAP